MQVNLRTKLVYGAMEVGIKDMNEWINEIAEKEIQRRKDEKALRIVKIEQGAT